QYGQGPEHGGVPGIQGFFHGKAGSQQQYGGQQCHDVKDPAPVAKQQDLAACDGGQDRGGAHDQHQDGHGARGILGIEVVTNDGTRDDHSGGAAKGLHDAPAKQLVDVRGRGTGQGGNDIDAQTQKQGALAAKAISKGAIGQLRQGKAEQVACQGSFDMSVTGMQVGCNRRKRWQIHVNGQRAQGRNQTHEDQPGGDAVQGGGGGL